MLFLASRKKTHERDVHIYKYRYIRRTNFMKSGQQNSPPQDSSRKTKPGGLLQIPQRILSRGTVSIGFVAKMALWPTVLFNRNLTKIKIDFP
jgi:hypothetical protein